MERSKRNVKRENEAKRGVEGAPRADGLEQSHRLRGDESADNYIDADADSCVASRHRSNDKESDS